MPLVDSQLNKNIAETNIVKRASGTDEPINHLNVENVRKYWDINKLVHAYNCTKNSSTGYAPYFLLFGRKPRLPIDVILSQTDDANEDHSHSIFVEDWKIQMSEAYQKALQNSSHRKEKDVAKQEMIKKLSAVLEQGDRANQKHVWKGRNWKDAIILGESSCCGRQHK